MSTHDSFVLNVESRIARLRSKSENLVLDIEHYLKCLSSQLSIDLRTIRFHVSLIGHQIVIECVYKKTVCVFYSVYDAISWLEKFKDCSPPGSQFPRAGEQ